MRSVHKEPKNFKWGGFSVEWLPETLWIMWCKYIQFPQPRLLLSVKNGTFSVIICPALPVHIQGCLVYGYSIVEANVFRAVPHELRTPPR